MIYKEYNLFNLRIILSNIVFKIFYKQCTGNVLIDIK